MNFGVHVDKDDASSAPPSLSDTRSKLQAFVVNNCKRFNAGTSEAVTWGDNAMRVGWGPPHRAKRPHASHAPPTALRRKVDSARKSGGGNRTKILYFNPQSVDGRYVEIIRRRGHDVATASSGADALAMMRRQIFDVLVMDCAQDTLDTLNLTAKAQGLQPSLAVFLADEWGEELPTGLEELGHVLTMLEDDECARLAVENQRV